MRLPNPIPGLVVEYAFLWSHEHAAALEEGVKNRPCAILLSTRSDAGPVHAYMLAITHSRPNRDDTVIEIPLAVKRHLGLDRERSWIVLDEVKDFI